jgi:hypothetical protein
MQHDAAGAALDLGASLALFPCRHLPRSTDAASGAADAERSAAPRTKQCLVVYSRYRYLHSRCPLTVCREDMQETKHYGIRMG